MTRRLFLRHPPGIAALFLGEMWERFSFYGMRALLVLYMTKHFGFEDAKAYALYGLYGALVYACPLLGGKLADHLLGLRRAAMFGAGVMVLGHAAMAVESPLGLYAGMALVAVGNGFFKPSMSAMVGPLYAPGDTRREAGYTIFYMGINLGAAAAPFASGWLGEMAGWRYGFGAAGIGMAIGLLTLWKLKHLLPEDRHPAPSAVQWLAVSSLTAGIAAFAAWMFAQGLAPGYLLILLGGGMVAWLLSLVLNSAAHERRGLIMIGAMMLFHTAFWACFEQMGSSLNLFADRVVDRELWGYTIPASAFQAANPVFVLLLAPFFAMFWTRVQQNGRQLSYPLAFGAALAQVALAFACLVAGNALADGGKVAMGFLLATYFFNTTAELCISPIGMAMVSRLSPARYTGALMGMWFLSIAFAHFLAAAVAQLTSAAGLPASAGHYADVFGMISLWALGLAVACALLKPLLDNRR